jgi:hypothetical protein
MSEFGIPTCSACSQWHVHDEIFPVRLVFRVGEGRGEALNELSSLLFLDTNNELMHTARAILCLMVFISAGYA